MSDGVVNVWDPSKLLNGGGEDALLSKVSGHEGPVRSVEFNPTPASGHLIATGARSVRVYVCVCLRIYPSPPPSPPLTPPRPLQ